MSSGVLFHIRDRVSNKPLCILPEKLAVIADVLSERIGIEAGLAELGNRMPEGAALAGVSFMRPSASRFVGDSVETDAGGRPVARLPYRRTSSGVGIVTITGSLVNRGAWIGANSGLTSYEGIAHQLKSAAKDPKVRGIIMDIESGGGEAVGAFEVAELVRAIREEKPVFAHVSGLAASAAYAIASGATRIYSIESGTSGSIGVVLMHVDASRKIDREGLSPSLIFAGKRKVDANPLEPLSDDVKARLQAEVNAFYESFISTVAAGRGRKLSAKAARDTEAATYKARDAAATGMIDGVATFDELVAHLSTPTGGPVRKKGNAKMETFYTDEDIAKARADGHKNGHAAGLAEGKAQGVKEGREAGRAEDTKAGATAERARIKAIVEHDNAKGREAAAQNLALNTEMSAETAVALLATLPKSNSIGARAAETVTTASVDTGEGNGGARADAGNADRAPSQNGAVSWASVAESLNPKRR